MKEVEVLLIKVAIELIVRNFKIDYKTLSCVLLYLYLDKIDSKNNKSKSKENITTQKNKHCKNKEDIVYKNSKNIKKENDAVNIAEKEVGKKQSFSNNYKRENIKNRVSHNNKKNRNNYKKQHLNIDYKERQEDDLNKIYKNESIKKECKKKNSSDYGFENFGKNNNLNESIRLNKKINKKVIKKDNEKLNISKNDVILSDSSINDLAIGEIEFKGPVLKILNSKSEIFAFDPVCIKCKEDKMAMLVCKGFLSTTIKYLEPKNIVKNGFYGESKYYVAYIPFQVSKKIKLEFNPFKNGKKVLKNIKVNIKNFKENICTEFIGYSNKYGEFKSKYKLINTFKYNIELLKEEKVLV